MVKIRPHHILCIHGFVGKGYSPKFVDNMQSVIEAIVTENKLRIVFSNDDICVKCPHLQKDNSCQSQDYIQWLDAKTISELNLTPKEYSYQEILESLRSLSDKTFEEICKECSWYRICKENIIKRIKSAAVN